MSKTAVTLDDVIEGQREISAAISELTIKQDGVASGLAKLVAGQEDLISRQEFAATQEATRQDLTELKEYTHAGFETMLDRFDRLEDRVDGLEGRFDAWGRSPYQH